VRRVVDADAKQRTGFGDRCPDPYPVRVERGQLARGEGLLDPFDAAGGEEGRINVGGDRSQVQIAARGIEQYGPLGADRSESEQFHASSRKLLCFARKL
jgi:hypothetical protein